MDEQVIQERIAVLASMDTPACEGCGASALTVADDVQWYIDTLLVPHHPAPYTIAVIRCPNCW